MRLAFPWALLLLLPIAKMAFDHFRKGGGSAVAYSSLAPFGAIPRTMRQRLAPLPFWLRLLALLLLVLALARPQRPSTSPGIPKEGIAIELVVDTSSSMDIAMPFKNTRLSRMEVTKRVVEQFVKKRTDDLIGLVTFARYADTVCPLTLSHDALLYFIGKLQIESRPNEDGTAFGDALALAAARLRTAERRYGAKKGDHPEYTIKSKVVILLTDGNNNCGRHLPMEGAALAKRWGIRVHTIAITDPPEKKTIQTPDGPVEVDAPPTPQERVLRKIAETTGGIFRQATDEASLRDIYDEIDKLETSELETARYRTYVDIFQPFAAAALVLLLLQILLEATWLRKIP